MDFLKKSLFFSKIDTDCKFAVECVSNGINSIKCLFCPNYECFWQKMKKFKVGKVRKCDEVFFEKKKRFHLLKSLLCKNGKAQSMPVVPGRLAYFSPHISKRGRKLTHLVGSFLSVNSANILTENSAVGLGQKSF